MSKRCIVGPITGQREKTMSSRTCFRFAAILASALALAGCQTVKPYDYTKLQKPTRRARSWSCRH